VRAKRAVAPAHRAVRYQAIEQRESDKFERGRDRAGDRVQPAARKPCDRFLPEADLTCGKLEIGRQRQADPNQEWSERYQGPVGEDALNPGTRRGYSPDQVELILDRDEKQNAGRRNPGNPDSRGLRRRIGEGAEPPRRLLADRRHQHAKDQRHQLVVHLRENRKSGQRAKGDDR
jgi:hypothetical protein